MRQGVGVFLTSFERASKESDSRTLHVDSSARRVRRATDRMGVSASRDSSSTINARDGARDHHNARIRVRVCLLC